MRPLRITQDADTWLTLPKEYFPEDDKLHDSVSRCRHGMGTTNRDLVSYWGNLVTVEADGATCELEILSLRNRSVPKRPFVLCNRFGKGHVSYLAGRVGQSYETYSYPHLRRIVVNEIARTADSQPPVQIDAPLCVEATCWTQTDETGGNRVVIQLLNDLAGRGRPAVVRGSLPLREEVVRVSGIRIRLCKPFDDLMLRSRAGRSRAGLGCRRLVPLTVAG